MTQDKLGLGGVVSYEVGPALKSLAQLQESWGALDALIEKTLTKAALLRDALSGAGVGLGAAVGVGGGGGTGGAVKGRAKATAGGARASGGRGTLFADNRAVASGLAAYAKLPRAAQLAVDGLLGDALDEGTLWKFQKDVDLLQGKQADLVSKAHFQELHRRMGVAKATKRAATLFASQKEAAYSGYLRDNRAAKMAYARREMDLDRLDQRRIAGYDEADARARFRVDANLSREIAEAAREKRARDKAAALFAGKREAAYSGYLRDNRAAKMAYARREMDLDRLDQRRIVGYDEADARSRSRVDAELSREIAEAAREKRARDKEAELARRAQWRTQLVIDRLEGKKADQESKRIESERRRIAKASAYAARRAPIEADRRLRHRFAIDRFGDVITDAENAARRIGGESGQLLSASAGAARGSYEDLISGRSAMSTAAVRMAAQELNISAARALKAKAELAKEEEAKAKARKARMGQLSEIGSGVRRGFDRIGQGVAGAARVGVVLTGAAGYAASKYADWDQGVANVNALLQMEHPGRDRSNEVSKILRSLVAERRLALTPSSAQEFVSEAIRSGETNPEQIKKIVRLQAMASRLEPELDPRQFGKGTLRIASAFGKFFGKNPETFMRVAGGLAAASNFAVADVSGMLSASAYAIQNAASKGMSPEEMFGMLAMMSDRGLANTKQGTAVNALLDEMFISPDAKGNSKQRALARLQSLSGKKISAYRDDGSRVPVVDLMRQYGAAFDTLKPSDADPLRNEIFGKQASRAAQLMMEKGAIGDLEALINKVRLFANEGTLEGLTDQMSKGVGSQITYATRSIIPMLLASVGSQVVGQLGGKGMISGGVDTIGRNVSAYGDLVGGGDMSQYSEKEIGAANSIQKVVSDVSDALRSAKAEIKPLLGLLASFYEKGRPIIRFFMDFYSSVMPIAGPLLAIKSALSPISFLLSGTGGLIKGGMEFVKWLQAGKVAAEGATAASGGLLSGLSKVAGFLTTGLGAAVGVAVVALGALAYQFMKTDAAAQSLLDHYGKISGIGADEEESLYNAQASGDQRQVLEIKKRMAVKTAYQEKKYGDQSFEEMEKANLPKTIYLGTTLGFGRIKDTPQQLGRQRQLKEQGEGARAREKWYLDAAKEYQRQIDAMDKASEPIPGAKPVGGDKGGVDTGADASSIKSGGGGRTKVTVNVDGRELLSITDRARHELDTRAGARSTAYQSGFSVTVGAA